MRRLAIFLVLWFLVSSLPPFQLLGAIYFRKDQEISLFFVRVKVYPDEKEHDEGSKDQGDPVVVPKLDNIWPRERVSNGASMDPSEYSRIHTMNNVPFHRDTKPSLLCHLVLHWLAASFTGLWFTVTNRIRKPPRDGEKKLCPAAKLTLDRKFLISVIAL